MAREFLGQLTVDERLRCFDLGALRMCEPGASVAEAGAEINALYVILSGTATVIARDGRVIAQRGAGEILGEVSLLDHRGASATVRAETKLSLLVLSSGAVDELIDQHPNTAARFYKSVAMALGHRLRAAS